MKRMVLASLFAAFLIFADLPTRSPFPGQARVTLSIRDAHGNPTGLRLRVTNAAGEYFPPLGHLPVPDGARRSATDLILGDGGAAPLEVHALVYDGAQIDLPPGTYNFHARKGLEYEFVNQRVEIAKGGEQTVRLPLRKYADFEAKGWYPGDTHMHFPDLNGVRYQMECEGLRVCSLLLLKSGYPNGRPGDGHFQNVEHFTGKLAAVSDAKHFVKVGEEFRHGLLAHLIFQNLKSIVWPVSTGGLRENGARGFDWPLMLHACDDAHKQGALVTWAHWPYPSMEAPMDIALGRVDSLDILTTGNPFEHHPILTDIYKMQGPKAYSTAPIEMYYHYLNCGFRLAVSSGSDKMGLNPPMGSARTYVKTEGALGYDSWIEGIRKGRTFISTYPLLEFSVNGKEAGDTITLAPGKARLKVKAQARSLEAYEVLEILVNGKVVRTVKPAGAKFEASIEDVIEVDSGGWVAARAHGRKMLEYGATWWKMPVFAHTSPVYLDMKGRPAPAAESAALLLDQLEYLERWAESRANFPRPEDRTEALRYVAEAKAIYEKRARE
ncbi:MAG: hypothetical protein EXQ52_07110 [Bryobacterales bacterium]|nr:hypothetical protein [Bryobacterales bacterium]